MVRDLLVAFADQDLVAFVRSTESDQMQLILEAVFDPDIEVRWVDTSPDSAPYHGHDGALRALTEWLESFGEFHFTPDEFIDAGDEVVVPNFQQGTGRGSGAVVEMTTTWVCTVRNGKIARIQEYATKTRTLQATRLTD
jgi:ketosteroid isomerase-like protein